MGSIDAVLDALRRAECKPHREGHGYRSRCPCSAHENGNKKNPALFTEEKPDGEIAITCHARACDRKDILETIGLTLDDVMAPDRRANTVCTTGRPQQRPTPKEPRWVSTTPVPDSAPSPPTAKFNIQYEYRDERGRLLGIICRKDLPDGEKKFWPLTFGHMSNESDDRARWGRKIWSGASPLYGLDLLTKVPEKTPILIVEGEKAADAARGMFPLFVVMTSPGGSKRAHKANWGPLRGRSVVVWPDSDEPGRKYADDVARLVLEAGAESVRVVEVPENWPEKFDLADELPEGVTSKDLRQMVADAPHVDPKMVGRTTPNSNPLASLRELPEDPTHDEKVTALRAFAADAMRGSTLDREVTRNEAVKILQDKGLKSPTKMIDAAISDATKKGSPGDEVGSLQLREVVPTDGSVDGIQVLEDLSAAFKRFIVLPEYAAETLALWVVFSYAFSAFNIAPILCISSAEKGSGKTTLLDVIFSLVNRPLMVANATVAALFRSIDRFKPTILIDEADSFFQDNEDLRGILNAGHRKGGAVLRTVGDDHEPKSFPVWSPKAVALIGNLPGTLEDRSIVVRLRRASRDEFETIERFKLGASEAELAPLARRVARWAVDRADGLVEADPDMPDHLFGRPADNWRPLLSIADTLGGRWPKVARDAAVAFSDRAESESLGVVLLGDLLDLFNRTESGGKQIERWSSVDLVEELSKMEDRPWPEFKRGRPLTVLGLSKLLRPYEIQPTKIRFGNTTARGYRRSQFIDAWSRYLKPEKERSAPVPPFQSGTPEQRNGDGGFLEVSSGTREKNVPGAKSRKVNADGHCSGVPGRTSPQGQLSLFSDKNKPKEGLNETEGPLIETDEDDDIRRI